eukprot:1171881-Ditylum_brightwellii.AAC.1
MHLESQSHHLHDGRGHGAGRGYLHPYRPFASRSGDYKSAVQFGPQKDFLTLGNFMKWKFTQSQDGSAYAMKNSLCWIWCNTCNQWGCHKQMNCRAEEMRNQRLQNTPEAYLAPTAKIDKDAISIALSINNSDDNCSTANNTAFLSGKSVTNN